MGASIIARGAYRGFKYEYGCGVEFSFASIFILKALFGSFYPRPGICDSLAYAPLLKYRAS